MKIPAEKWTNIICAQLTFPNEIQGSTKEFPFSFARAKTASNRLPASANILLPLIFVIVWFDHSMYDDDENLSLTHSLRFGSFVQIEKKRDSQKSTSGDLVQIRFDSSSTLY